jgi:hypothetical protein
MRRKNSSFFVVFFVFLANVSVAVDLGGSDKKRGDEPAAVKAPEKVPQKLYLSTALGDKRALTITPVNEGSYGYAEFTLLGSIGKCVDVSKQTYLVESKRKIDGLTLTKDEDGKVVISFTAISPYSQKEVTSFLAVRPVGKNSWESVIFAASDYSQDGYISHFQLIKTKEGLFKIMLEKNGIKSFLTIPDGTGRFLSGVATTVDPYFASEGYLNGTAPMLFHINEHVPEGFYISE